QAAWESLVERRQAAGREREAARGAWQEHSSAHRAAREQSTMLKSRQAEIERLLSAEVNVNVDQSTLTRLEAVANAARQATDALRIHLDTLRARQADLRAQAGEAGARLTAAQEAHDHQARRVADAKERLGSMAVERAELRLRREQVAERLRRDADADEETALAAPRPEVDGDLREE